jgi:hypothetical protein
LEADIFAGEWEYDYRKTNTPRYSPFTAQTTSKEAEEEEDGNKTPGPIYVNPSRQERSYSSYGQQAQIPPYPSTTPYPQGSQISAYSTSPSYVQEEQQETQQSSRIGKPRYHSTLYEPERQGFREASLSSYLVSITSGQPSSGKLQSKC